MTRYMKIYIVAFFILVSPFWGAAQVTFQETFQGGGMNGDIHILQTVDGGYITVGQHASSGAGDCDAYVFKRDGCGNFLWFKTYGGGAGDGALCIQETPDGGYIVSGLTELAGFGSWDIFLMKIDIAGNLQWFRTYGGAGADYGQFVQR